MTDPRRATIAALQAKPADLPLLIANSVLCTEHDDGTLRKVAGLLGVQYVSS